jgi:hypothetical protein
VWLPVWLAAPDAVADRLAAAVQSLPEAPSAASRAENVAPLVATALADLAPVAALPAPAPESPRAVAALRAVVPEKVAAPVPPPAPVPAAGKAAGLEGEAAFAAWTPKPAGDRSVLDGLPATASARVVRRVLTAGIKAEGPIHADRLARLAAGAFGVERLTAARKAAILSVLPPSALDGEWLWPANLDRSAWTTFRRQAASSERPLEHVPPEEIGNAMAALCRAAAGMQRDELLTRAAAVFGYKRRTPTITPLLEAALNAALAAGRLAEQPDGLITAA